MSLRVQFALAQRGLDVAFEVDKRYQLYTSTARVEV